MRRLILLLIDVVVAILLFVGIQACRGYFSTVGDVFTKSIWLAMPSEDVWILLLCLIVSLSCIKSN